MTPSGIMLLERNVDYCEFCGKTFPQGDAELDINEKFYATNDLIEIVSYAGQIIPSFRNAQDLLSRLCSINISFSNIQKITEYVGEKVFEVQKKASEKAYNEPEIAAPHVPEREKEDCILYMAWDGSAVNTILKEAGTTWKEMKLGMIFTDKDIKIRKEQKYIEKKEYVAYFGKVEEFKKFVFEAAARAGYGRIKKVVVLGDGAQWVWNICVELFPDAICILDLYHLKENVFEYAKALFPNNEKKYTKWAKTVSYYVETDQVDKALKKIKENPLAETAGDNVVKLDGYINNNIDRINYLKYKNQGFYVGSGMIESGNKVVVQKRMKQAGQRWRIDNGQSVVTLRAKYESDKWDEVSDIIHNRLLMKAG